MSKINCVLRTFLLLFLIGFLLTYVLVEATPQLPTPRRC